MVTIYLDSSDYSALSNPKKSASIERTRLDLLSLASSPHVQFTFSGVHISEMAPLESQFSVAANNRADLLSDLCGRNAFISIDRILQIEISRLANPDLESVNVLTNDATWFPELGEILSPVQWAPVISETIRETATNRAQRRLFNQTLLKRNRPKASLAKWMQDQGMEEGLRQILTRYPMRPENAKSLNLYVLGKGSKDDAERAFLESLRDPRWMMRWFAEHHQKLTPVIEWLRSPSRNMAVHMKTIAERAKNIREMERVLGPQFRAKILTRSGWNAMQDDTLLNIANRLLAHFAPNSPEVDDVALVDINCRGLATCIRSLHSSLWNSVGREPRVPQESDFADAIHAIYSPYVKLFRADRYMAPFIDSHVSRYGTEVVSAITDVPDAIRALL